MHGSGCWGVDIVHSAIFTLPLVCKPGFFQDFDSGKWHLVTSGVQFQISWSSLNRSFIVPALFSHIPLNHKMAPTKNDVIALRGELILDWIQFWCSYYKIQSNTIRTPNRIFRQCQFGLIEIYVFALFSCSCWKKREVNSLPPNFLADAVFTYSSSFFNPWKIPWNWILKILLLCHLVCYKTWWDATLDDLQTRPLRQILLFLWNNSLAV